MKPRGVVEALTVEDRVNGAFVYLAGQIPDYPVDPPEFFDAKASPAA
jgi:hypothetical protein